MQQRKIKIELVASARMGNSQFAFFGACTFAGIVALRNGKSLVPSIRLKLLMEPHLIFFTVAAYAYFLFLTMYFCPCS